MGVMSSQVGSASKALLHEKYTVTDIEGDNVVVTEFVDDVQIRSYQATLGQEETIELTRAR